MNLNEALQVMGLERTFSQEELKKVYRRLSKQYHPDMQGGDSETFEKVAKAHKVLRDYGKKYTNQGVFHDSLFHFK